MTSTTHDLIKDLQSRSTGHCGYIGPYAVLGFPDGNNDYLIKIDKRRELKRTTALTGVDYGLPMNFGQPVMVDMEHAGGRAPIGVAILGKVPGESLESIEYQNIRKYMAQGEDEGASYIRARAGLLEKIANLPDIVFERWFQSKHHLLKKGIGGDNHVGNIMYDEYTRNLRDIDVVEHGSKHWKLNNLNGIVDGLTESRLSNDCLVARQTESEAIAIHKAKLTQKLSRVARTTKIPRDQRVFNWDTPPEFHSVNLTGLGKISLSDKPEKLWALLREMEARGHIHLG